MLGRLGRVSGPSSRLSSWTDPEAGSKTGRRGRHRGFPSVRRTLILAGALLWILVAFWCRYQLHVEIQAYRRGWISKAVLPIPPLSSTCFSRATIDASTYNTTLANGPRYVDIHAGIGMPLGDDCYNFASTIPKAPVPGMMLPSHTTFHTYWRAELRPLGRRQIALLRSLLVTQDHDSTSVILWTNSDAQTVLKGAPELGYILSLFGERFSIETVQKSALARGTPMEQSPLLNIADEKAWLDGDLVRILVLWARGGVWVDMDTIMTGRDVRVLTESEWVTQWDCYDKIYQPLNGAMMHFYENSPFLCEMLYAMANDPAPRKGTTDWGSHLYHKVWRRLVANSITPFKVLPYCFTDGRSCRLDNRLPDPFKKGDASWGQGRVARLRKKVDDVWAVHLHNQWEKNFPAKGWVQTMVLDKVDAEEKQYRTLWDRVPTERGAPVVAE